MKKRSTLLQNNLRQMIVLRLKFKQILSRPESIATWLFLTQSSFQTFVLLKLTSKKAASNEVTKHFRYKQ